MSIKEVFRKYKCDKVSHGYHEFYESILNDRIETMLEIGVKSGKSLASWKEALPNARICGLDVSDKEFDPNIIPKDVETYVCDSTIKDSSKLITDKFDLIIDDGSHFVEDQIMTFENFMNSFNKYYVIEDIFGENIDYVIGYVRTYKNFKDIRVFLSKQSIPMYEYQNFLRKHGKSIRIKHKQEGFDLNMYAVIITR